MYEGREVMRVSVYEGREEVMRVRVWREGGGHEGACTLYEGGWS